MTENVIIGGLARSVPEWSTEETLLEIKELLQTQVQLERTRDPEEKREKRQQQIYERKKDQKQSSILIEAMKTLGGITGVIARLMKAVIAGGASIETVIKRQAQHMVDKFGEISKQGGLTGNILGTAVLTLVGTITFLSEKISVASNAFKSLYDTGFSLGGQFGNLYVEAGKSAMTLKTYAQALEVHAVTIKGLTNEYERGEIVFGQLSRSIRESLLSQGQLLLSTSELNEYLGEYLETLRLRGRLEDFDRAKEQAHMTNYLKTITDLTRVTGKRREQIFEEVQAFTRRADIGNILSTVPEEVAKAFESLITGISSIPGMPDTMKQAMAELFEFDALSPETARLHLVPGLVDIMRESINLVKKGVEPNAQELITLSKRMKEVVQSMPEDQRRMFARAEMRGVGGLETLNQIIQSFLGLSEQNLKDMKKQNSALANLIGNWESLVDKALGPLNDSLGNAIKEIETQFGEKGITQEIITAFKEFNEELSLILTSENVKLFITDVVGAITSVARYLVNLFTREGRDKMYDDMISVLSYVFERLATELKNAFIKTITFGLYDPDTEERKPGEKPRAVSRRDHLIEIMRKERDERKILRLEKEIANLEEERIKLKGGHPSQLYGVDTLLEEKNREIEMLRRSFGTHPAGFARGGIATMPSVFGEKGPEAAIPLDGGRRIPVAELKGDFNKKELTTMINAMNKFIEKQGVIIDQNDRMIKKLDRVNYSIGRSGERIS